MVLAYLLWFWAERRPSNGDVHLVLNMKLKTIKALSHIKPADQYHKSPERDRESSGKKNRL